MTLARKLRMYLGILLVGAACAGGDMDTTALDERDIAAIETLANQYVDAVLALDAYALAALYAPDAVQMPPGQPPVEGREAIRQASDMDGDRFHHTVSYWGLSASPDGHENGLVYDRGTYGVELTVGDDDEPIFVSGSYLVLLERQPDGTWLIAREIWTRDSASNN